MTTFFWTIWTLAAITGSVVVVFFLWGAADGTVSSFNIGLWTGLLALVGSVIGGGLWLHRTGHTALGAVLLLVLAAPGTLYALFLLIVMLSGSSWN